MASSPPVVVGLVEQPIGGCPWNRALWRVDLGSRPSLPVEFPELAGLLEPIEVAVEVPSGAPAEVPFGAPVEVPSETPVELPSEVPVEVPEMIELLQPVQPVEQSESSP